MGIRMTVVAAAAASVMAVAASAGDVAKVDGSTFAKKAAVISKAEIELGQLALTNSNDKDVKDFAARMVEDHTAADQKLKAAATADNIALPKDLDPKHAALKKQLQGLKGDKFDDAYIAAMASGHDEAVVLFESASRSTSVPEDLREFAAGTLPTLKEHKQMAHELHGKEGG